MQRVRITGIALSLGESEGALKEKAATILRIPVESIVSLMVVRKSMDARRRRPPNFIYSVEVSVAEDVELAIKENRGIEVLSEERKFTVYPGKSKSGRAPVVVGCGPAGLFAALSLAEHGIPPVLLERGKPVDQRIIDVQTFWERGILDTESHVHFGEGGAGTFSDGKLTSRVKNPRTQWVKKCLVDAGASSEILIDAKPHIGTDRLREVVANIRKRLLAMGCEIRFESKVTDFLIYRGKFEGVVVNDSEEIRTDCLVLATGQSADDTYGKLYERGVHLTPKPFAVGFRVEHPQELINGIQYGRWHEHPDLPPADYSMAVRLKSAERSVYTFCMCPGGSVIGCSSDEGEVVTNGMSYYLRGGPYANSAVVVTVHVEDFKEDDHNPLRGLEFRRYLERKAFLMGGGNYYAPAQGLIDFLRDKEGTLPNRTSFVPGVKAASLFKALPRFAVDALKQGINEFDRKMRGFITEEAMLIGVETRTSSPVRIVRGPDGQNVNAAGLYPCGEGAGYAGGIISSALDGIRIAEAIISDK